MTSGGPSYPSGPRWPKIDWVLLAVVGIGLTALLLFTIELWPGH